MAGEVTAAVDGGAVITTTTPLQLVREVVRISAAGFSGYFKKDCMDLARRVSLLVHFLEEIGDFNEGRRRDGESGFSDLTSSLLEAKRLIDASNNFDNSFNSSDEEMKKFILQFQIVTMKLERGLAKLPYNALDISEEVYEQVELVMSQLRRATERFGGPLTPSLLCRAMSHPLDKDIDQFQSNNRLARGLHLEGSGSIDHQVQLNVGNPFEGNVSQNYDSGEISDSKESLTGSLASSDVGSQKDLATGAINSATCKSEEEKKKPDSPVIPDDFLCPISLELMKDPVIVATGQTYERSCIQRWIDCGNTTCPKTRQKLQHLTLTPNYVLRSLISQWCMIHNIEQSTVLMNGKIKKSDGTIRDVTGDVAGIQALVHKLSSSSTEERRAAVVQIRTLSKRSTDNRILLADAGAIPILVNMLTSDDSQIQDNAVTSILNLSIFDNNKGLIMLANAIPSIVHVLRAGSMEAKENAAATLFSLSLADENKIIIGASGAIQALVDLLQNGSPRGKKDAATALFNLCIYQGNKGRAVRAGIITALLKMLTDSRSLMVDESLTILSVLAYHQEAKAAIVKASTIPVLIDLLRTGLPRNKENAAAILLSLCKRDNENLSCLSRLGAVIPLSDLAKNGTERAKRKATSLLEHLRRRSQQV